MVCIAAFIVLLLISVVVAFLSIFKPSIGKEWLKLFKKAWYCFSKKVRLQKCDTNFQDDVKHAILKKVALKHPTWLKPLSAAIEVFSVVIVVVFAWAIIISTKSLLALWVFGTCNVSQPSQCGLGAEACTIDQGEPTNLVERVGRSIGEWGQIFEAIPDRLKDWKAEDYLPTPAVISNNNLPDDAPLALDIVDPGCSVCLQSYRNQLSSGFFNKYRVAYLVYPIQLPEDGGDKFNNSTLIARYIYATAFYAEQKANNEDRFIKLSHEVPEKILNRIFTESNEEGINYQSYLQNELSDSEAESLLKKWLSEFGYSDRRVAEIADFTHSNYITDYIAQVRDIVDNRLNLKSIPTFIYDGRKHSGLYRPD